MWGKIFDLENPLIGADNTWMLWTVVCVCAALAIYLEQRYNWAAKVTGAILALVFALVLANTGIVPMSCSVWDIICDYAVPLAIPLLLFQCDLRKVGKTSGRMLLIFLISSVGTVLGAFVAYFALRNYIPELAEIAGMMTGSYIGGGVNFVALASSFDISKEMVSATTVADNLLMAAYIFVLIMMPTIGFFRKHFKHPLVDEIEKNGASADKDKKETNVAAYWNRKEISLKDIALCVASAFTIVTLANIISGILFNLIPDTNAALIMVRTLLGNSYFWITTISIACASFAPGFFGEIRGAQEIGTFMIYLFFFVIGVPASISMILKNSPLLLVFTGIMVLINMIVSFVIGKLCKFNLEEIIIASDANIGGPTGAAALAVSKGWTALVGPSVLVGTLGYVIGTYCGLFVGGLLGL